MSRPGIGLTPVVILAAELTATVITSIVAGRVVRSLPPDPPPDGVALAVALVGASLAAAWLLAVTAAAVAAELPVGRDLRWIRRLGDRAPSRVRRLVRTAAPLVALVSTLAPGTTGAVVRAEPIVRGAETSTATVTSTEQPVVRAPARTTPRGEAAPPPARAAHRDPREAVHVVVAGDNLWTIAAARLADEHGTHPSSAQIVPYWRAVIAANVGTLRSGNPNLIFPGEVVELPRL
jgi:hypothetical protein